MTKPLPLAIAGLLLTAACVSVTRADLIVPVGVSSSGSITAGTPSLIIDGIVPPRFTPVTAPTVVSWNSLSTSFTIDFGKVYTVQSLTVAVDNNDTYLIQSSTDGVSFANLFTFLASDGPVQPGQGGLDILSTNPTFPVGPNDNTTPAYVGRTFAPTDARYLRISATDGDSVYGIGEVQAFSPTITAVPEPASGLLLGAGIVGLVGFARRHKRS